MQIPPQLGELHRGVVWCVDYEWHGEEEGGRRLGAEQVGMQLLPAWYANEWVGGVQVGGGSLLQHFYTSRGGHKSGKGMS